MNGEVENTKEKKKQIRLIIIGVVALLLLTLGATFAFFLIDTDNSTSKSQINADIDGIDSIALQKVTENLHVNLNAADMSETNKNTEYFGDDAEENNYVKTLEEGLHTLGSLTAEGGNGTTRYMCTANAVVTMQVASENDMGKHFQPGDAYLYLNAGSLQQRIDLSELLPSGTKTIPFEIAIQSEGERILEGYVEIINRDDDQTYLANKTLNIDVTFQALECNVGVSEVETYLRGKDTDKKLTENLVNGMYRYQGNSIVNSIDQYNGNIENREDTVNNNYICLGSDCSENSDDMYRIIGITEDGLMKVVKNTPSNDSIAWNSDYQTDIKWPESTLYQFLNTEYYNSLPIELKNKIVNATWLYGDVDLNNLNNMSSDVQQKMREYYEIIMGDGDSDTKKEAAKNLAKLYSDFLVKEEAKATNKTIGNISLMNITDYCSSFESDKELNCMSTMIGIGLDGFADTLLGITWLTPYSEERLEAEQLMTRRYGTENWMMLSNGLLKTDVVSYLNSAKPVFYLKSDIEFTDDGEGTVEKPFRVVGIE